MVTVTVWETLLKVAFDLGPSLTLLAVNRQKDPKGHIPFSCGVAHRRHRAPDVVLPVSLTL